MLEHERNYYASLPDTVAKTQKGVLKIELKKVKTNLEKAN